ncbi:hypothetical protein MOQ_005208 [Trypanosoma cruzi marinkellei]|uniref:Uncharacterized protein n=1 Tax=Trypanosoma cruzi marinkellei TaxID=85056 RepID=K2MV35_TRYCR|nr:hypothetical protein MOQ_005208 [Trypanosoma cruzi marinkellei]
MKRFDGIDMDVEGLMANAVHPTASRQQYGKTNNPRWNGPFIDGDYDCDEDDNDNLPPCRRSISWNQLLYSEPLPCDVMAKRRPITEKLSSSVNNNNNNNEDNEDHDGLTAIQRLIDAEYDSSASRINNHRSSNNSNDNNKKKKNKNNNCNDGGDICSEELEGKSGWNSALPPRPVCYYSTDTISKEDHMRPGDREGAKASRLIDKRETCSVGVQCDMRATKTAATLQQLEQLRQQLRSDDPESIARLLAQYIRELEMERFGHSSAFTSALLQQL